MSRNVMLILMESRQECAEKVQKTLTAWGCLIKTRLGLHDGVLDNCTSTGLLFLELVGVKEKHLELARKINLIKGVHARFIELSLDTIDKSE